MLQYVASDNMLVDYFTKDFHGNFDIRVAEDQCAYLQFSDGRRGFFGAGDHCIHNDDRYSLFKRNETVELFWFNLSDHIEIRLTDTIKSMEQLLKTVVPELKTYYPVDLRICTDISVQIEDKRRLLELLLFRQSKDLNPVLDKDWLKHYLEKHLHYQMEESINRIKQQYDLGIFSLSSMTDEIETALIDDLYSLLHSLSLDLVAFHITKIGPTAKSLQDFREREHETLNTYNQIQMENFCKQTRRSKKKVSKANQTDKKEQLIKTEQLAKAELTASSALPLVMAS